MQLIFTLVRISIIFRFSLRSIRRGFGGNNFMSLLEVKRVLYKLFGNFVIPCVRSKGSEGRAEEEN